MQRKRNVISPAERASLVVNQTIDLSTFPEAVGVWRLVGCLVLVAGVVLLGI